MVFRQALAGLGFVVTSTVLAQAADLGVLQLHLSGGEPTARRDLEAIVAGAAIVRVHDVAEHAAALSVFQTMRDTD